MVSKGKLDRVRALDVSHTANLNESSLLKFIRQRGRLIEGLAVAGKPRLAEQFFVNIIPLMKRIKYAHAPYTHARSCVICSFTRVDQ